MILLVYYATITLRRLYIHRYLNFISKLFTFFTTQCFALVRKMGFYKQVKRVLNKSSTVVIFFYYILHRFIWCTTFTVFDSLKTYNFIKDLIHRMKLRNYESSLPRALFDLFDLFGFLVLDIYYL